MEPSENLLSLMDRADPIDPAPGLTSLARTQPVCPVQLPDGSSAYVVTGYDAVRSVLADARFSRVASHIRFTGFEGAGSQLIDMDPPEHTRLKRVLAPAFTRQRIVKLRPTIERLTDELLDDLTEHGPPADLVAALAAPLPLQVICEMWGIPKQDRGLVKRWTREVVDVWSMERSRQAALEMMAYIDGLIAERREQPADDLITELVTASEQGRLTAAEMSTMLASLASIGHETTVTTISRGVVRILREPERFRLIATDPTATAQIVEELIRLAPPTQLTLPRAATADVDVAGTTIPAGSIVLPCTATGNRDASRFSVPDEISDSRHDAPHLSFGHGPHYCLGAALGREELVVAFTKLAQRFPRLRLAVDEQNLRWAQGELTDRLHELPVAW